MTACLTSTRLFRIRPPMEFRARWFSSGPVREETDGETCTTTPRAGGLAWDWLTSFPRRPCSGPAREYSTVLTKRQGSTEPITVSPTRRAGVPPTRGLIRRVGETVIGSVEPWRFVSTVEYSRA